MEKDFLKVSLRQNAIFVPDETESKTDISDQTLHFVARLRSIGFGVSEPLLHALNGLSGQQQADIMKVMNEVMGVGLNWAPLVKGWLTPTGESSEDHLLTLLANIFGEEWGISGTRLACGHLIPDGTFPLERYNGCPFCGRPFTLSKDIYHGQGSKLKTLSLWRKADVQEAFANLLMQPVPPDATQADSLKLLLAHLPLPADVQPATKETLMLVVNTLMESGRDDEAGRLLSSPTDVLRYLWYRHTGLLQLVEPRTLIENARHAHAHIFLPLDRSHQGAKDKRRLLRLKYSRAWCLRVAKWLNALPLSAEKACEQMHAKREMWVRMIRALRLTEYSKRPGMEPLRELLDRFYRRDYTVWQGQVDEARRNRDQETALSLLQQRPGIFARSLFANMLWFGPDTVMDGFNEVADKLPLRLLFTLGMYADNYFDPTLQRVARPLGGIMKTIPAQPLLKRYNANQLADMSRRVKALYTQALRRHFEQNAEGHATIYIAPQLFDIPLAIGDRSATIQDVSAALQGTRFQVEGDAVRLFLQWGQGLHAQHLDMDLSCHIIYDNRVEQCAYFNLSPKGALHSGDIREVPELVGTAEYVELNLPTLQHLGARYAVFTCNAYSNGNLSPNLVVGWMNTDSPMKVSNETGVAYDPSTVQHQVRISESNLAKGLVFGVLNVAKREITWLEIPFGGQTIMTLNLSTVEGYLRRLASKTKIGEVLSMKAEVQGLKLVENADEADEVYTYEWAKDTAAVSRLLL